MNLTLLQGCETHINMYLNIQNLQHIDDKNKLEKKYM